MIVLDIETTGIDETINSILSIGAVSLETNEEFYIELKARNDDIISPKALEINGFTLEECYKSNISQEEGYLMFVDFCKKQNDFLIGGQQIGTFDLKFLKYINDVFNHEWLFGYRSVDLHSIAYHKYKKSMSLDKILIELGLDPEPKPHNALTGALLEAKCFQLI